MRKARSGENLQEITLFTVDGLRPVLPVRRRLQHLCAFETSWEGAGYVINQPFSAIKIRLRVNQTKSAVAHVQERKFLGYRLLQKGVLGTAPASLKRVKDRIRQITRCNRGVSKERVIRELNEDLTGWITYFRYTRCRNRLRQLESWLRRKVRCYRLKQRERAQPIADFLIEQGVPEWRSWLLVLFGNRHIADTSGNRPLPAIQCSSIPQKILKHLINS